MGYKMFSFAHKMLDYNLSYVTTTVVYTIESIPSGWTWVTTNDQI